jgi:hypothetical protein
MRGVTNMSLIILRRCLAAPQVGAKGLSAAEHSVCARVPDRPPWTPDCCRFKVDGVSGLSFFMGRM